MNASAFSAQVKRDGLYWAYAAEDKRRLSVL